MTILQLIITACIAKGVPEKYAERIQKAFKIEKAEGLETFVDMFKENVLPAITEADKQLGRRRRLLLWQSLLLSKSNWVI